MKIIRPQNNTPTKKQLLDKMTAISQECKLYDEPQIKQSDELLVNDNTYKVKEGEPIINGYICNGQTIELEKVNLNSIVIGAKVTEEEWNSANNTCKDQTIENLMDEIIKQKDDKVQVTISLTKRQYDLYLKKGGESWIKKVITGQKIKKSNRKA